MRFMPDATSSGACSQNGADSRRLIVRQWRREMTLRGPTKAYAAKHAKP
jgi:hypothetical protein